MRTIPLDSLDLAEFIRPGDGIVVGQGTSEPIALTQALVAQREHLGSTRLFFGSGFSSKPLYCLPSSVKVAVPWYSIGGSRKDVVWMGVGARRDPHRVRHRRRIRS